MIIAESNYEWYKLTLKLLTCRLATANRIADKGKGVRWRRLIPMTSLLCWPGDMWQ